MAKLVIVESGAKAKIIQKYLNNAPELNGGFKVMACFGHIVDMPTKTMAVDTTTWNVTYEPIPLKKKVISDLRKAIKEADFIYMASDLDLEGEALGEHIVSYFKIPAKKYTRITFSEITPKALVYAIQHPRDFDLNKVAAQETRRILDRVVGYEASPLLWHRFATSKLSAGRVQSSALKMLVERHKAYIGHNYEPFWTLNALFNHKESDEAIQTTAYDKTHKAIFNDIETIKKEMKKCWKYKWNASITWKETHKNPSAPFTTSTMQQEVYNRFKIPAKQTMKIAQELYEAGHITYMRTDSTSLSDDAHASILDYIKRAYGNSFIKARIFKTKVANAQEAHEAIRPTNVTFKGDELEGSQRKVYELIWRRTVASQMIPATYKEMILSINTEGFPFVFKGITSFLVEAGFLTIYNPEISIQTTSYNSIKNKYDNTFCVTLKELNAIGDVTRPLAYLQEPTLVKCLEKEGIGRPSTYASIIDKLLTRTYVMKASPTPSIHQTTNINSIDSNTFNEESLTITVNGSERDCMIPTSLGIRVAEYLEEIIPNIVDLKFTSEMESKLDAISEGNVTKNTVLNDFYKPFHNEVEKANNIFATKEKTSKQDKPLQPKQIIKEFESSQIVQTKYGPALFKDNKFVSITPFIQWKNITIEDISEQDVAFLLSLPKKLDSENEFAIGRYGIYWIHQGKNKRLPQELWDKVYNNTISINDLESIPEVTVSYKKKFVKK